MPLFHVAGLGQLLGVTASGGCHIFDPAGGPAAIYDALRDEGVNTIIAVPTTLAMLLDSPLRDDELLARIEAVGYGATAISQSLLERLLQALPKAGLRQVFGQNETGASGDRKSVGLGRGVSGRGGIGGVRVSIKKKTKQR